MAAGVLCTAAFILFDLAVYFMATKRCIPDKNDGRNAKTVDVAKYFPFDGDSLIVDEKSGLELAGELPVFDGAEALFPCIRNSPMPFIPKAPLNVTVQIFLTKS